MPLHVIQRLSPTAVLGLWHRTEAPAALWTLLPRPDAYHTRLPATADATRQAQWLAGRVLLHELLRAFPAAGLAQATVQNDATGRPWLVGAPSGTVVSLSHSGAWVAAVLALSGRAGVDVEIVRGKAQRLASKFLTPDEWADAQFATRHAPDQADAHYTLLWSAKETLYKLAAQRGIIFKRQLLLRPFVLLATGEINSTLIINNLDTRHCICYTRPAPGYVLTYSHEPVA